MRLEEASNGVTSEVGAVGDEGIQDGLQDAVRFVWHLLTDERNPAPQIEIINENPFPAVMAAEEEGISREDFLEAIDRIAIGLDDSRAAELQTLRETIANSSGPDVTHVTRRNVTQVFETNNVQVSRTIDNRVENTSVENTSIDNRVVTEINARGDVDFDLAVENETVIADDGAVAVGGNVEESAINTGVNTGVIAGDDVGLSDSIIGDDNLQANLTAAPASAPEAKIEEAPLEEAPQDEPVIEQPVFEDESFEDDLVLDEDDLDL